MEKNAYLKNKFVRLRCRKRYHEAHTHLIVGQVIEETGCYLVVKGRTFHYKRIVDCSRAQIMRGEESVRIIPWDNVEIIHELTGRVDANADFVFDAGGNVILADYGKTLIMHKGETTA